MINKSDSSRCKFDNKRETLKHIIFKCDWIPRYLVVDSQVQIKLYKAIKANDNKRDRTEIQTIIKNPIEKGNANPIFAAKNNPNNTITNSKNRTNNLDNTNPTFDLAWIATNCQVPVSVSSEMTLNDSTIINRGNK